MRDLLILFLLCPFPPSSQPSTFLAEHLLLCCMQQGWFFHDMYGSIFFVSREAKRSTLGSSNLLQISLNNLGFSFYSLGSWICRDSQSAWTLYEVGRYSAVIAIAWLLHIVKFTGLFDSFLRSLSPSQL